MWTQNARLELDWIKMIGSICYAFKQTYLPFAPAELTCIEIIGDSSKFELEEPDESYSGLIYLPIRGYLLA